jgi:hypothetical protein
VGAFGAITHPALHPLKPSKRGFLIFSNSGGLYRLLDARRFADAFNEVGDYGFCVLLGIPAEEEDAVLPVLMRDEIRLPSRNRPQSIVCAHLRADSPYVELCTWLEGGAPLQGGEEVTFVVCTWRDPLPVGWAGAFETLKATRPGAGETGTDPGPSV